MNILVKCEGNWADEFDVFGLAVMTKERYNELLLWSKNASWMFGSNEGFENDEDISSFFSILSEDEEVIEKFVSMMPKSYSGSWGQFPIYFDE